MRGGYWDKRLERWGAWRVGSKGVKVATFAGMRSASGSLASWQSGDDAVPELHIEERETHAFVQALVQRAETAEMAAFAMAAYPRTSRLAAKLGVDKRSLAERFKRLHRLMARMLDQRQRGEAVDAVRRPARGKPVTVRADVPGHKRPRAIASVVMD